MKKEIIKNYTTLIPQCNKTQLLVVVYEIMISYLESAKENYYNSNIDEFIYDLKHAQNFLGYLISTLDNQCEVSHRLFNLYLFWNKQILSSILKKNVDNIDSTIKMIKSIHDSYEQLSKEDNSTPLMGNVQKVYAGYTYGKNSLSEMSEVDVNRGFQA